MSIVFSYFPIKHLYSPFKNEDLSKSSLNTPFNGEYALHRAVKFGEMDQIRDLINRGAKAELKDSQGMTAYDYAMLSPSSSKIIPLLFGNFIEQKIEINTTPQVLTEAKKLRVTIREQVNLLSSSHLYDQIDQIPEEQLATSILESIDSSGNTYFHFLAAIGDVSLLNKLIDCGIDINQVNKNGQTPLHFACAMETAAIKLLIDHGAKIHQPDHLGVTPLSLIAAIAHQRDPLDIPRLEACVALFAGAGWIAQYALNEELASYAIMGLASTSQILSYGSLASELFVLFQELGWEGLPKTLVPLSLFYMAGFQQQAKSLLRVWQIQSVAISAFKGLVRAWKNRTLSGPKALRNSILYTFNLIYFTSKCFDQLKSMFELGDAPRKELIEEIQKEISKLEKNINDVFIKPCQDLEEYVESRRKGCMESWLYFFGGKTCPSGNDRFKECIAEWEKDSLYVDWQNRIKYLQEDIERLKQPYTVDWQRLKVIFKRSLYRSMSWVWSEEKKLNISEEKSLRRIILPNLELVPFDQKETDILEEFQRLKETSSVTDPNSSLGLNSQFKLAAKKWHPDKCPLRLEKECTEIIKEWEESARGK